MLHAEQGNRRIPLERMRTTPRLAPGIYFQDAVMTHHGHDHHRNDDVHEPPGDAHRDAHAAHDKHAGHSVQMFRDRFWLTLLLTIPTVIWSGMIQHWFGYRAPRFPGSAY